MKTKFLIFAMFSILTSCTSLTGVVTATQMMASANHTDLPRPEYQYKKGDKITMWGLVTGPKECEVLDATSNPYSPEPMLAKYEVKCGKYGSTLITDHDLKTSESNKIAFLKEHGGRVPAEYKPKEALYKPGTPVTYYDYDENKLLSCKVLGGGIDEDGLGPSDTFYSVECEGENEPLSISLQDIRNGNKLKKTGLSSRESQMKETAQRVAKQRIEAIKTIKKALKD